MDERLFQPRPRLIAAALALCAVGLVVAAYLTWLHYQVHTDPGFRSFCAMSDRYNCETVAESPHSVVLGVPVAFWGMAGYAAIVGLLLAAARRRSAAAFLAALAGSCIALLSSIILAVISYCIICSFCILCSITYVINVLLVTLLLLEAFRRHLPFRAAAASMRRFIRQHLALTAAAVLALLLLVAFYPKYWEHSSSARAQVSGHGVTEDGRHWLGAAKPTLTITEFSDYLCPHCKRGHLYVRGLVAEHPTEIRLIHRHFPLDHECNSLVKSEFHRGACGYARAAVCAGEQDKFWKMNDLLYDQAALRADSIEGRIAYAAGMLGLNETKFAACMAAPASARAVEADVEAGLALDLRGTPAFVVDGKVHMGTLPKEVLAAKGIGKTTE